MADSFRYDVFISHSLKDKGVVIDLAQRLKRDGLRVWTRDEQGLEQSRVLVLAMSANAFASEWATLERHTVMFRDPTNAQRRFVPLRLDDADVKDTRGQYVVVVWRRRP